MAPTRGAAVSISVTAPAALFQSEVATYQRVPENWLMLSLPTRSPAVLPTRLLAADTTPVVPAAESYQVIAPMLPDQFGLNTASLPLVSERTPALPIWSPALAPTRLLAEDTTPDTPVVRLNGVIAPALPFQEGLRISGRRCPA
jgi:hypothetical protein